MEYRLTEDWKDIKEIIIFGFGKVAHDNIDFFKRNFNIVYIVDSNKEKCNCEFKDILVENKGEQWISELYISATEYSITIVYKRGGKI